MSSADPSYCAVQLATGDVTTVTLNRPERLNAFSRQMLDELYDVIQRIAVGDIPARALLITGAGRGFCAGADLVDEAGPMETGKSLLRHYHPLALEITNLNIPVVTAVNGVAAGAGMSLALNADFVIAAESASFLQAFVNIGLVPDMGSSYMLPRLIGPQRARRMMMLGEKIPAATAADWGMLHDLVPDADLMATAMTLAETLSQGPTQAYGGIRALMRGTFDNSFEAQIQREAGLQRQMLKTEDAGEGVTAFIQKRSARFKGC